MLIVEIKKEKDRSSDNYLMSLCGDYHFIYRIILPYINPYEDTEKIYEVSRKDLEHLVKFLDENVESLRRKFLMKRWEMTEDDLEYFNEKKITAWTEPFSAKGTKLLFDNVEEVINEVLYILENEKCDKYYLDVSI